jgi:CRISPR/Cas system-associated protein endoribonuclease Cas2
MKEFLPGKGALSGIRANALECFYDGSKVTKRELKNKNKFRNQLLDSGFELPGQKASRRMRR